MVSVTEAQESERSVPRNVDVASAEAQVSKFLGAEYRVLLTAAETGGAASVVDVSLQAGAGAPLHTNTREALIWYVIEGRLTFNTEQGEIHVETGGAVFLPQGSTHVWANASGNPARALLLCIPGGFEGFLLELGGKLPTESPAGPPAIEAAKVIAGIGEKYGLEIHLGS